MKGEPAIKIGAVFPQTKIGEVPDLIAKFATTAESLGDDHLLAYNHVLDAISLAHDTLATAFA